MDMLFSRSALWLVTGLVFTVAVAAPALSPETAGAQPASAFEGAPDPSETFSPEALREDVQAMMATFEAVHPDLYRHVSRRTVRRRVDALLDSLDGPMTRRAFYVAVARLAASFGDGHTRVDLPKEAFAFAARGGMRAFPATVRPAATGLAVDRWCSTGASLPAGARLLSVNGRDAGDLFHDVQDVLPGTSRYRSATAGDQFPYLLWAHGVEAPFEITYAAPGAEEAATVTVDGARFGQVRGCLAAASGEPFSFERRGDVGVLTLRRLRYPARFRQFLAAVADSLGRRPVSGLVIDLRNNSGGRTRVAEMMLAALTDDPVRLTTRKDWKVSDPFKAYLRRTTSSAAYDAYFDQRPGKVLRIRYDEDPLPAGPLEVDVPVAVLVGPRTFSSAVTLSATIQAYDLAVLVGEETGGRANRFGEGYPFRLPNTGLRALVSSAYFVQASGDARSRGGVEPDVRIAPFPGMESDVQLGVAMNYLQR